MPKTDTGIAQVVQVGLQSDEAQGYEHLAAESQRILYERPTDEPSFLERHGGPAYEAEVAETLERIRAKVEEGIQLHRSERAFLYTHEAE